MIQPFPRGAMKGSRDGPTVSAPAAHSQVSNRPGFFSQIISTIRRKCTGAVAGVVLDCDWTIFHKNWY
jgi:hypothetical protein